MTKALVVIDVQKAMFENPALQPFEGEAVVDRIAGLIAKARAQRAPVFFVQHDGGPGDSFHPGKPGFAFHDKLTPQPGDDVTVKTKSSAFHGADLDARLRRAGIDRLVITGMQSEYCATSAIRGAYERGYKHHPRVRCAFDVRYEDRKGARHHRDHQRHDVWLLRESSNGG